jgi:hypothetical protein
LPFDGEASTSGFAEPAQLAPHFLMNEYYFDCDCLTTGLVADSTGGNLQIFLHWKWQDTAIARSRKLSA